MPSKLVTRSYNRSPVFYPVRTCSCRSEPLSTNLLHSLVPLCVLGGVAVWRRPSRMGKAMPGRSVDQPHTHTQARPHAHTHTYPHHTNSSRFLYILIHRSNPRTRYRLLSRKVIEGVDPWWWQTLRVATRQHTCEAHEHLTVQTLDNRT